jgi:fructose-1,6-bisphosphatase I
MQDGRTTLTQFIIEEQRTVPGASGNFTGLISDIVIACKQIAHDVNKGALIGVLGSAGSENVQGETQKKLDIITNEIFINPTMAGHTAAVLRRMDDVYPIPAKYPKASTDVRSLTALPTST